MKTAVLDAGGGLRGIYGAGVLDYCLDHGIYFDLALGVSAGAANLSSYTARQKGRNFSFYKDYCMRPEYMSLHNKVQTGNYVNLDYIYQELSNKGKENPLDFPALKKSSTDFYAVCTNALTGQPVYFSRKDMGQDHYEPISASCSIPVINKPYYVKNIPFFDGAISDPIPMDKAFSLGADKVVIILTKPKDLVRKPYKDRTLAALMNSYPKAAEGLRHRVDRYNETVARARELEQEGKVLIVAPDDTCGVDTLTRDRDALHSLYLKGYLDGQKIEEFLQSSVQNI